MPQQIQFSADPAEDYKRLESLAIMLRDYGIIHDDLLLVMCHVMSRLYRKEALIVDVRSTDPPDAEDLYVSLADLFDQVTDKSQYVIDLRNVINNCFGWGYGDIRRKADEIKDMREIGFHLVDSWDPAKQNTSLKIHDLHD
jgi:hypothetical protein